MHNYFWFSLFVAMNGLLLVALAANVSILRIKNRISYGDGGNKNLLKAIRVHANGMEQTPIFALLLLALTYTRLEQDYLATLALVFTLSRISHAVGMLFGIHILRRIGASLTYILQIAASVILLISLIT